MSSDPISERIASLRWTAALVLGGFLFNAGLVILLVALVSRSPLAALVSLALMAVIILVAAATTQVRLLWEARPQPLVREFEWVQSVVDDLARDAGVPSPRVGFVETEHCNALTSGRGDHAKIIFYGGLLRRFAPDEVRAVAAHEIGHLANGDTTLLEWTGAVFTWVLFVRATVGVLAYMIFGFSKELFNYLSEESGPFGAIFGLFLAIFGFAFGAILLAASYAWTIIARAMEMALSRQREYLADATAVALTGDAHLVARALAKLKEDNPPMRRGASTLSAYCITAPAAMVGWWEDLFSTHPPLDQRIDEVRKLASSAISWPKGPRKGVGAASLLIPTGAVGGLAILALAVPAMTGLSGPAGNSTGRVSAVAGVGKAPATGSGAVAPSPSTGRSPGTPSSPQGTTGNVPPPRPVVPTVQTAAYPSPSSPPLASPSGSPTARASSRTATVSVTTSPTWTISATATPTLTPTITPTPTPQFVPLTVQILYADQSPVAGSRLVVYQYSTSNSGNIQLGPELTEATTGPGGRGVLRGPPGNYVLVFADIKGVLFIPGVDTAATVGRFFDSPTTLYIDLIRIDVQAEAGSCTVGAAGSCTALGTPAQAQVCIWLTTTELQCAQTAATGDAQLNLMAGSYDVRITASASQGNVATGLLLQGGQAAAFHCVVYTAVDSAGTPVAGAPPPSCTRTS